MTTTLTQQELLKKYGETQGRSTKGASRVHDGRERQGKGPGCLQKHPGS